MFPPHPSRRVLPLVYERSGASWFVQEPIRNGVIWRWTVPPPGVYENQLTHERIRVMPMDDRFTPRMDVETCAGGTWNDKGTVDAFGYIGYRNLPGDAFQLLEEKWTAFQADLATTFGEFSKTHPAPEPLPNPGPRPSLAPPVSAEGTA